MSLDTALPYGLRDVKLFPLTGDVAGTGVDLPNSRTLTFAEAEDFEELRGDDSVVAVRGKGASVNWELEAGGVSFEAIKTMFGGTITETGTTPNQRRRYRKNQNDARPYFRIEGKALSDSGGDFHCVLYRARCTGELSGEMADGSFWLSKAGGRAIGRTTDGLLYDFVQNETEEIVNVVPEADEVVSLTITGSPTGGTFTVTFGGDTSDAIDFDAAASVVEQTLQEMSSIGTNNAVVSGTPGAWEITFVGDLAATNVGTVTTTESFTGGTSPDITVTVVTPGGR